MHGVKVLCGIKGYMRVCEKTVLDYRGNMSLLRDLVRGMLVCSTLEVLMTRSDLTSVPRQASEQSRTSSRS